ncbi:hypothetical protein DPMN_134780 [Dreissena polymorpha]|uniref:Uncharacterized protein n=1 Tax=Dreissena polymorpha TaxID=45954 RepID=A0A9D4FZM6_DREPO|nr:hypothetical protein DPMN_134780 [Dreissena polymorpha]
MVWLCAAGVSRSTRRKFSLSGIVTTHQTHMLQGTGIDPSCLGEKNVIQPLRQPE